MPDSNKAPTTAKGKTRFILVILGCAAFCGISQLSRSIYPLFGLVIFIGIVAEWGWDMPYQGLYFSLLAQ